MSQPQTRYLDCCTEEAAQAWEQHNMRVQQRTGNVIHDTLIAVLRRQLTCGNSGEWQCHTRYSDCSAEEAAHMWEQHNMGFQQGNGDVPGVVGLAQELDEL